MDNLLQNKAFNKAFDLEISAKEKILTDNIKEEQKAQENTKILEDNDNSDIIDDNQFLTQEASSAITNERIKFLDSLEKEKGKFDIQSENTYDKSIAKAQQDRNKQQELIDLERQKNQIDILLEAGQTGVYEALQKQANADLNQNYQERVADINQKYAIQNAELEKQYRQKLFDDTTNFYKEQFESDIQFMKDTNNYRTESYIKNISPYSKFVKDNFEASVEFASGLRAAKYEDIDKHMADYGFSVSHLLKGGGNLGDSLLGLLGSIATVFHPTQSARWVETNFFSDGLKKLGLTGYSPNDILDPQTKILEKLSLNLVLQKTLESIPEMLFVGGYTTKAGFAGVNALRAEQALISEGIITKKIASSIDKQLKILSINRHLPEVQAQMQGLFALRKYATNILKTDESIKLSTKMSEINKQLGTLSKYYQEATFLGKAAQFPF